MAWQEVCVLGVFAVRFELCDLDVPLAERPLAILELCESFSRHPDRVNRD